MRTRQLGCTNLQLSVLGLGTWGIGGGNWEFGWGDQNLQDAVDTIHRALELGVNWIDTAPVYGLGQSEELVGRALRDIPAPSRPMLATKCGRVASQDGQIVGCLAPDSIQSECEDSLRRLGVDAIDLYQLHWPDPDPQIEDAWATLLRLKQQGKVRHVGVSNHSVAQIERLRPIHPVASLQPPYSLLARGIESEVLDYCGQRSIGVIAYSPMGKGLLTGGFSRQRAAALPQSDHRSRDPKFTEPQLSVNLEFVEGLRSVADRENRSVAHLALSWVLRRPEVTAAIAGARKPEQVAQLVEAADWEFSISAASEIDQLSQTRDQQLQRIGNPDAGRV